MLWRSQLCVAGGSLALVIFGAVSAAAGNFVTSRTTSEPIVHKVHSVNDAEQTLYRRGYSDVQVERPSLPYSFSACKRGVRYHIHIDDYGDLVQVDAIGRCSSNAYRPDYDGRRRYYGRYRPPEED
jgi:hypothetical protein